MTEPREIYRSNRPQWLDLHPTVYRLLVASTVGLFLSAWAFFGHDSYTAFQLGVVAVFLAMFVGTPWMLSRMARKKKHEPGAPSFGEWRAGDFLTYTGPIPAGEAAMMIMIAPAAAVGGLAAISAVAYLAAVGAI